MRPAEAEALGHWVLELGLPAGSVCLNIGSSTKHVREIDQPHIENRFVAPLKASGLTIVHCDMKRAAGVDEVGDVLDPVFRCHLKTYRADLLICSNLLEHLRNPNDFAHACGDLVRGGGYALFSVPSSYPYHPDPIDTLLRPSPEELTAMLPGWDVRKAVELTVGDYWEDLERGGAPVRSLVKHVGRVMMPFYRPTQWRGLASRLLWLFRDYRVSVALLQKPINS
jgi:SAM-dependent methyltransferase